MEIMLTGAAGFIGTHVVRLLLARGDTVVDLDNLNAYCDPQLKRDRLALLTGQPGFSFEQVDVADRVPCRPCSKRSASAARCTWQRKPACAIR